MSKYNDLKRLAKDAGDYIQYACNMSGICFSFGDAVNFLVNEAFHLGKDIDWINNHPVVVAWVDKFDDLSCSRGLDPIENDWSVVVLARLFKTTMEAVNEQMQAEKQGGDWRNRHPKTQNMIRRLVHVTKSREGTNAIRAMGICDRMAQTGKHEPIPDWKT